MSQKPEFGKAYFRRFSKLRGILKFEKTAKIFNKKGNKTSTGIKFNNALNAILQNTACAGSFELAAKKKADNHEIYTSGDWLWVPDEDDAWVPAKIKKGVCLFCIQICHYNFNLKSF